MHISCIGNSDEARSGIQDIAAGFKHNVALKDGKVIVWNYNGQGQMDIPATVREGGVTRIASTFYHVIALR